MIILWGTFTAIKVSIFGVFLLRIFRYLGWIWRDTAYLSVFSPNAGKWGPEKLRIQKLFYAVILCLQWNVLWLAAKLFKKNYLPSFHSIYEFSHHRLPFHSNWLYSLSLVQSLQHNIWSYQHQKLCIFVGLCDSSPCFGKLSRKDLQHNNIDIADQLNHYRSTPCYWNIDLVQSNVKSS